MTAIDKTEKLYQQMRDIAPAHGALLQVRQGRPGIIRNNYPIAWRSIYASKHYFLRDPSIHWGLIHDGTALFSDLKPIDPSDVVGDIKRFGLGHGFVAATGDADARSILNFARADRPFDQDERDKGLKLVRGLHQATSFDGAVLTPCQIEALRMVSRGQRHAEAAHALGISESAFKARLKSARINLGARTTAEAVRVADVVGAFRGAGLYGFS